MRFILLVVALLATLGCAKRPSNYPYEQEPDPRAAEYVIGVPDTLRISVWRNPELSADVQVRSDGTITLPLIGDVRAAGLTPTQLRDHITKRLATYIKVEDSTISVAVVSVRSYRITVTGSVTRPSVLYTAHYLTVGEAIALAGGPTRFADPEDTELVRTRPDGSVVRIPIRYDLIMQGKALNQDLALLSGDVIFVP